MSSPSDQTRRTIILTALATAVTQRRLDQPLPRKIRLAATCDRKKPTSWSSPTEIMWVR
ncbi:hypothetical protein ACFIOY_30735 [Bradyrhizobium sp. TZ2]